MIIVIALLFSFTANAQNLSVPDYKPCSVSANKYGDIYSSNFAASSVGLNELEKEFLSKYGVQVICQRESECAEDLRIIGLLFSKNNFQERLCDLQLSTFYVSIDWSKDISKTHFSTWVHNNRSLELGLKVPEHNRLTDEERVLRLNEAFNTLYKNEFIFRNEGLPHNDFKYIVRVNRSRAQLKHQYSIIIDSSAAFIGDTPIVATAAKLEWFLEVLSKQDESSLDEVRDNIRTNYEGERFIKLTNDFDNLISLPLLCSYVEDCTGIFIWNLNNSSEYEFIKKLKE